MFVWDEKKREANLTKHGFDFYDAALVFEHPDKITVDSQRGGEQRHKDLARVQFLGIVLALVYAKRGSHVRIISYRRASRSERNFYQEQDRLGES